MHALVDRLARILALLGGAVLTGLIVLTCLSVLGRSLNSILNSGPVQSAMPDLAAALISAGVGPINGDFELVEAGLAFSIFAFLPLCQLNGAHASVDIFTARLPLRANRLLRMVIEAAFAAALVVIAWQLLQGMLSKRDSGQTTLLLQFPVWWAYAASVVGAVAAALISIYLAAARLVEIVTGQRILPPEMEADH